MVRASVNKRHASVNDVNEGRSMKPHLKGVI